MADENHLLANREVDLLMSTRTENMNPPNGVMPVVIPAVKFKAEVLESKQPALVEFWANWSMACRVFESVLQELATALQGQAKVIKVNADDSLDLSLWYDIQSVPTLICFLAGHPRLRIVGTASKEAVLAKVLPVLSSTA